MPSQAQACACGAFVSPDPRLAAVAETALVEVATLAKGRKAQTLVLNLGLSATPGVKDAAFVMPVPGPATFSLADAALFRALDFVSRPKVQTDVEHYFDPLAPFMKAKAGAAPGALAQVTVAERIVLGPYDVVMLAGTDASALRDWLRGNGFRLSDELAGGLTEYLQKGWQVVAVKLMSAEGLRGLLPPMRITFESDETIYPMRLSAHAKNTQHLRVYVLADHRADITTPAPGAPGPAETFAGWTSPDDAPALGDEFSGKRFLTRYDQEFAPSPEAADIRIAAAPDDSAFRAVVHVVNREPWPWTMPLCFVLCCALPMLVVAALPLRSIRRRIASR